MADLVDAIMVDLDGTLCDTRHRDELVQDVPPRWDDHSMACIEDDPVIAVMELIEMMSRAGYYVVLCSGRGNVARELTEQWLDYWDIAHDLLILREPGDLRNNATYKLAHIRELREQGINVRLLVDDYFKVHELLEDVHGIPVLRVHSYTSYGEANI